jgi:hypothetical protein
LKRAGAAKGFVEPEGDNSIPTFGGEGSAAETKEAEAALRAYLAAAAQGNWAAACREVATSLTAQVQKLGGGSSGCPGAYRALSAGTALVTRADLLRGSLVSLRVEGANAFALFYGPKRQQYVMPMMRESSGWKVTEIAPVAYPLGSEKGRP